MARKTNWHSAVAQSELRTYIGPSLLMIDVLGYLPMDQTSAQWVFRVVSRRYERGSIILTSNKSFAERAAIFSGHAVIATAMFDRLLHHTTVVNVKDRSYRMRRHQGQLEKEKGGTLQ
jgi:DNA replication protein DnaC